MNYVVNGVKSVMVSKFVELMFPLHSSTPFVLQPHTSQTFKKLSIKWRNYPKFCPIEESVFSFMILFFFKILWLAFMIICCSSLWLHHVSTLKFAGWCWVLGLWSSGRKCEMSWKEFCFNLVFTFSWCWLLLSSLLWIVNN